MSDDTKGCLGLSGCFGISGSGCLSLIIFNLIVGGWSFQYALWGTIGRDVPWYWDVICGLFLAEITTPVTIILLILKYVVGIPLPLHPM